MWGTYHRTTPRQVPRTAVLSHPSDTLPDVAAWATESSHDLIS